jgi:hypothetical protein
MGSMNLIGKLFGSDKAISKAVDGIYDGLDALVLTPEERLENFNTQLKLYEPFKVAQRLLACIFGIPYSLAWFVTFCASFVLDDITPQIELLTGTMGQIVLAIVAFYFVGGVVDGLKQRKK